MAGQGRIAAATKAFMAVGVLAALAVPAPAAGATAGVPGTLYDGWAEQAGKRSVIHFTTRADGWLSPGMSLTLPRGLRCGAPGRRGTWVWLGPAPQVSAERGARRLAGRFVRRYRWRHPQDRAKTIREDVEGGFSEGGALLTLRYRVVRTTRGRRCDTGVVRAAVSAVRYAGATELGHPVAFRVLHRRTTLDGTVTPNIADGVLAGPVPRCWEPPVDLPETLVRHDRLTGEVHANGTLDVWTRAPLPGEPPTTPLADATLQGGLLPAMDGDLWGEGDDFATSPATVTGTVTFRWTGADVSCPAAEVRFTARREHPEHAIRLPRPKRDPAGR